MVSILTCSSIKTPVNPFFAKKNIGFLASQLGFQDIEVIGFGTKRCQSLDIESVNADVVGTNAAEKDVVFCLPQIEIYHVDIIHPFGGGFPSQMMKS